MHNFTNIHEIETELHIKFNENFTSIQNNILDIFNSINLKTDKYDTTNILVIHVIGLYYEYIKNYIKMEEWYLKAIDLKCGESMYNLAEYYCKNLEYDKCEKYYLLAIEHGNVYALNGLGFYYGYNKHDYKNMKKYLRMSADLNSPVAMYNLGYYYQIYEINYVEMKKWYWLAIKYDNKNNEGIYIDSLLNLAYYYKNITKEYDEMEKIYLMIFSVTNEYKYIFYLIRHYNFIEYNYKQFKKYVIIILNSNGLQYLKSTKKILNKFMFFNILKYVKNKNKNKNDNNSIDAEYDKIKNDKSIIKYINSLNKNIICECVICYENNKQIEFANCTHSICVKCCVKIKTHICPLCRMNI